jgi:3-phosphoshikimate 1-carboxyvinyltransferase
VPGSKSLTNRALLAAALAGPGRSTLRHPLSAEDTEVMAGALCALGASVEATPGADAWVVDGLAGPPRGGAEVWCGMAGTVARFLAPALAAGHGSFALDADPQLRRRPLGPVLAALRAQGARIDGDSLPLEIHATGLAGGDVEVDASRSSQFLSGLLLAAPLARAATRLRFGESVSAPYLELTLAIMRAFGAEVSSGEGSFEVAPTGYRPADVEIEPDASTASYFLASAALTATTVRLEGLELDRTSQGDAALARDLERMGCAVAATGPLELTGRPRLRGIEVEMGERSDVFMTLACVAPFADSPTTIEGIGHVRIKESDRLAATAENLRRLGIEVQEGADHLRVVPGTPRPARLPTYDDHRIAMAFSLIGTRVPVLLEHPEVVAKTCPPFFELWRATGAGVEGPEVRSA